MKKGILSFLICMTLCGALATTAAAGSAVEFFASLGESDWYGNATDDERISAAWELLYLFRYAGYPVGSIAANDLAQEMNNYFDQDKSLSVWSVAIKVLTISLEEVGLMQYLPQNYIQYYRDLYENDWYGTTTDDERIAMGADLLNIFRVQGEPVGEVQGHELAQAMNDYYDQDKSLSVWDVARTALESIVPYADGLLMPFDYTAEDAAWYQSQYVSDWYGTTTDDERIDMAWELLSILEQTGHAIGHTSANDFAQAINDFFDQYSSPSVWDAASIVL